MLILFSAVAAAFASDDGEEDKRNSVEAFVSELSTNPEADERLKMFGMNSLTPSRRYRTSLGSFSLGAPAYGEAIGLGFSTSTGAAGMPDRFHKNMAFQDWKEFDQSWLFNPQLDMEDMEHTGLYRAFSSAAVLLFMFEGNYDERNLLLTPNTTPFDIETGGWPSNTD